MNLNRVNNVFRRYQRSNDFSIMHEPKQKKRNVYNKTFAIDE